MTATPKVYLVIVEDRTTDALFTHYTHTKNAAEVLRPYLDRELNPVNRWIVIEVRQM